VLEDYFEKSNVYAYYVTGLRTDDVENPCDTTTSRWFKYPSNCGDASASGSSSIDSTTHTHISDLLTGADTDGSFVVDIASESSTSCTLASTGVKINVGSKCYEHVHPHLYNVYDFSYWTLAHPGNIDALKNGNPNPITDFANSGTSELGFPSWHSMNNWDSNNQYLTLIGKVRADTRNGHSDDGVASGAPQVTTYVFSCSGQGYAHRDLPICDANLFSTRFAHRVSQLC
jgi:hypothetical protein